MIAVKCWKFDSKVLNGIAGATGAIEISAAFFISSASTRLIASLCSDKYLRVLYGAEACNVTRASSCSYPIKRLHQMASNHTSLDAAATERKARLAKLKSLKRKQPDTSADADGNSASHTEFDSTEIDSNNPPSLATTYLSGRNYDPSTRGPKLGFDQAPTENEETLEDRAAQIAEETHRKATEEEKEDKPLDLFKLQPKKPNWDLKRDLAKKLEVLDARTDNAIARLVRERVEGAKKTNGAQDGEVGMAGEELVEGMHVREREEEEDARRIRQEEEEEEQTMM